MTCKVILLFPYIEKLSKQTLCRVTDPEWDCLNCEAAMVSCEQRIVKSSLKHEMPFHQLYLYLYCQE